jgi:glutathione S-transferase
VEATERRPLEEDPPMELHYIDGSPFTRIVRVLAREHAVACTEIEIVEFPPPEGFLDLNPLGQVPVLVDHGRAYFPTRVVIDVLLSCVRDPGGMVATAAVRPAHRVEDEQLLAVILGMGDALVAHNYNRWAGVGPIERNQLGFDPTERHMVRVYRTLDWLEARMDAGGFLPGLISVQDIALSCFILYSESRRPIEWRGRPNIAALIEKLEARPSFAATVPRPLQLK